MKFAHAKEFLELKNAFDASDFYSLMARKKIS